MATITKTGITTFNMNLYNIRINWTETVDTSTINISNDQYGTSSITFNVEMNPKQTGTSANYTILPVFQILLNGKQIFYNDVDYINPTRVGITSANSPSYWYTLRYLKFNGQVSDNFFSKTITHTRKGAVENVTFSLQPVKNYQHINIYTTQNGSFKSLGDETSTTAQLATLYTPLGAPTSISLTTISGRSMKYGNNYYVANGSNGGITLSWSGATNGTNNPIKGYQLYASINGGEYKIVETINGASQTSVEITGDPTAGNYRTYKVYAVGDYSDANSGPSPTSARVYKNRRPNAPTGKTASFQSTVNSAALSYSAGSDADGHPVYTYYSTSTSSHGSKYNNEQISFGSSNSKTFYLWSYDGLDFSSNYSTAVIRKDSKAPITGTIYYTTSQYVPYYNNPNYIYPNYIYINKLDYMTGGVSGVRSFNLYARGSSQPEFSDSNGGRLLASSSSPTFTLNASTEITSNYFQIGASITTTLGETSPIFWQGEIFCHGKAITADEFIPTITVESNIDNDLNLIEGLNSTSNPLKDYFNKYLKINWTNTDIISPRFGISTIEGGVVNKDGNFISAIMYTDKNKDAFSPKLSSGNSNSTYLSVSGISYLDSAVPAIRVTPVNGNPFVVKANITKTKIAKVSFNGDYTISNMSGKWEFFKDGTDGKGYEIEFRGNKIIGDNNFLISAKKVTISVDRVPEDSYIGEYSTDGSSTPGRIVFAEGEFDRFKANIKAKGIDKEDIITYTIKVTDIFGNDTEPSEKVTQIIDFRVAPIWSANPALTIQAHYLNNSSGVYSTIGSGTNTAFRVLNLNEKIKISWPGASDPGGNNGNGDSNSIKYHIRISIDGESPFTITQNYPVNSYEYNVPLRDNCKKISFQVTAEDRSGLTTAAIRSSVAQDLYIGRCAIPVYELKNIKIDSASGILTGNINVIDYGDSRGTNSAYKNYERLGFKLLESSGQNKDIELGLSTNTAPVSFSSPSSSLYPKEGKVYLLFTFYPNYLKNYLSSFISYFFSFDGPTFSYRNHQIGINVAADNKSDAALTVDVNKTNNKDKIYFIVNKAKNDAGDLVDPIVFDLLTGNVDGLIVNCGTWD